MKKENRDGKKKTKSMVLPVAAGTVLILALMIAGSFLLSAYGLTVSGYTVSSPEIRGQFRVVQLSDLHNSVFGENNARLIRRVEAERPDLIVCTGDLLDAGQEGTGIVEQVLSELSKIAPVYVSFGNHESDYAKAHGTDLKAVFEACGAVVLDRTFQDITLNGQEIRIGGLFGYCVPTKVAGGWMLEDGYYLEEFLDTDRFTMLLCHMPYSWLVLNALEEWDIDTVLAGHVHGGQVRFPWIGGLWAPDQGWFPGRLSGVYLSDDETRSMVLSRGLGNTDRLPRFNNIPEIVVVDYMGTGK